ncbi:FG-GAP repeat domain-containing protein [Planctomycetes bacterium K23_9]|uniref:FG-GAP repeat protein n=1 Tax=Stieleria marina TaxID=1930275 RepID=A0A517NRQ1_9BACT|nr:FG-GAP repeat protein [Planctomycetes bacterium K23_9]
MRPFLLLCLTCTLAQAETWPRHTVDSAFQGADGVRLADFNHDRFPDIVTGWEESGVIRLYLNPGHELASSPWPAVTVGVGKSPEDAVAFDFNNDGQLEIISCHEGKTRQVLVHYCTPGFAIDQLLEKDAWQTKRVASLDGQMWMYAIPILLRDHRRAVVLGSKGAGASITLLLPPPADPAQQSIAAFPVSDIRLTKVQRNDASLADWSAVKLRSAGWIMSLEIIDMDLDGDHDVVVSDRKGKQRGVFWLEQPNNSPSDPWTEHSIGGNEHETMFIDAADNQILATTRNRRWVKFSQNSQSWIKNEFPNPPNVPFGKSIRKLGKDVFLMTANTVADRIQSPRPGIWIKSADQPWTAIDHTPHAKFDRMELVDLDGDGDLDVLTCEERRNLGVIWYENPGMGTD